MVSYSYIRYQMDGEKDPHEIKSFYKSLLTKNQDKLIEIYSWLLTMSIHELEKIGLVYDSSTDTIKTVKSKKHNNLRFNIAYRDVYADRTMYFIA